MKHPSADILWQQVDRARVARYERNYIFPDAVGDARRAMPVCGVLTTQTKRNETKLNETTVIYSCIFNIIEFFILKSNYMFKVPNQLHRRLPSYTNEHVRRQTCAT